ncbi:hypothetical protein AB0I72_19980 [Nocardiopsis sp. NPDC049922]|uniref:hypothetical protein n=1 Tax=Nocardiopsis sp. NPDC049922 TaxID=3155157 RepID=UPI00340BDFEA
MAARPRVPARLERDAARRMVAFFRLQRAAVLEHWPDPKQHRPGQRKARVDELFNLGRWDRVLTPEINGIALAASVAAGTSVMAGLDEFSEEDYDSDLTLAWLAAHAAAVAAVINSTTRADLATALTAGQGPDDIAALFTGYLTRRAPQIARTEVTAAAGFGTREAGQQTGRPMVKTWRTGSNPRSSHARVDGETVALDDLFSNGARWPGDSRLDTEDRANCNCSMEIDTE